MVYIRGWNPKQGFIFLELTPPITSMEDQDLNVEKLQKKYDKQKAHREDTIGVATGDSVDVTFYRDKTFSSINWKKGRQIIRGKWCKR